MLLVLALMLGVGYLAAYAAAQDKTPRGTKVGDVPVGGQTLADAAATLRSGLAARAEAPVTIRIDSAVGGEELTATPADLGLGVDYVASVREAGAGPQLGSRLALELLHGRRRARPRRDGLGHDHDRLPDEPGRARGQTCPGRPGPVPGHAGARRPAQGRPVDRPGPGTRGDHGGVPRRRPHRGRRPGRRPARDRRRRRPHRRERRREPGRVGPGDARVRRQPGAPPAPRLRRRAVVQARGRRAPAARRPADPAPPGGAGGRRRRWHPGGRHRRPGGRASPRWSRPSRA